VLHECRVTDAEVTGIGALTVTTPARTAADLLRTEPPARALAVLTELAALTGLTAVAVAAGLELMPRMRGVARARDLLAGWTPPGPPLDQSIRLPVTR
jgi:hypothetical protein